MADSIEFTIRIDLATLLLVAAYLAIGTVLYAGLLWSHREGSSGWSVEDSHPAWTALAAYLWPLMIPLAALALIGLRASDAITRLRNERLYGEFKQWLRERGAARPNTQTEQERP